MTEMHRTTTRTSAIIAAAIVGSCAVGLAPGAAASPCDPLTLSMTPQPALSCPGAPAAAPTNAVPVPAANAAGAAGNALPAPGQAPFIPPVVGADGAPTETFGQGGTIGDIFSQFHDGVPSDLIFGPAPPG